MKSERVISQELSRAKVNISVCTRLKRPVERKYWEGYLAGISLILETQKE